MDVDGVEKSTRPKRARAARRFDDCVWGDTATTAAVDKAEEADLDYFFDCEEEIQPSVPTAVLSDLKVAASDATTAAASAGPSAKRAKSEMALLETPKYKDLREKILVAIKKFEFEPLRGNPGVVLGAHLPSMKAFQTDSRLASVKSAYYDLTLDAGFTVSQIAAWLGVPTRSEAEQLLRAVGGHVYSATDFNTNLAGKPDVAVLETPKYKELRKKLLVAIKQFEFEPVRGNPGVVLGAHLPSQEAFRTDPRLASVKSDFAALNTARLTAAQIAAWLGVPTRSEAQEEAGVVKPIVKYFHAANPVKSIEDSDYEIDADRSEDLSDEDLSDEDLSDLSDDEELIFAAERQLRRRSAAAAADAKNEYFCGWLNSSASEESEDEGEEEGVPGGDMAVLETPENKQLRKKILEAIETFAEDVICGKGGGPDVVLGPHLPSHVAFQTDPRLASVKSAFTALTAARFTASQIAAWLEVPTRREARKEAGAGGHLGPHKRIHLEAHSIVRFIAGQIKDQCGGHGMSHPTVISRFLDDIRAGEAVTPEWLVGLGETQIRTIFYDRERKKGMVEILPDSLRGLSLKALLVKYPVRLPPGKTAAAAQPKTPAQEDPARGIKVVKSPESAKGKSHIFIDTMKAVLFAMTLVAIATHAHTDHWACFLTNCFATAVADDRLDFWAPAQLVQMLLSSAAVCAVLGTGRLSRDKIRSLAFMDPTEIAKGVWAVAFDNRHCLAGMSLFIVDTTGAAPLLYLATGDCCADAAFIDGLRQAYQIMKYKFPNLVPARAILDATLSWTFSAPVTRAAEIQRLVELALEKGANVGPGELMVLITSYPLSCRYLLAVAIAKALGTKIYVAGAAGALYDPSLKIPALEEFYTLQTRDPKEALVHILPYWAVASHQQRKQTMEAVVQDGFKKHAGVRHVLLMLTSGYYRPWKGFFQKPASPGGCTAEMVPTRYSDHTDAGNMLELCKVLLTEMDFTKEMIYAIDGRDSVAFREVFCQQ